MSENLHQMGLAPECTVDNSWLSNPGLRYGAPHPPPIFSLCANRAIL